MLEMAVSDTSSVCSFFWPQERCEENDLGWCRSSTGLDDWVDAVLNSAVRIDGGVLVERFCQDIPSGQRLSTSEQYSRSTPYELLDDGKSMEGTRTLHLW